MICANHDTATKTVYKKGYNSPLKWPASHTISPALNKTYVLSKII
jgi:hypothetical protein